MRSGATSLPLRAQADPRRKRAGPSPSVQRRMSGRRQQIGMRLESRDDLVEWDGTAAGHGAIELAFRTGVEAAKPAEIAIASRLDQEDLDQMPRNARADAGLIGVAQGAVARPAQIAQTVQLRQPYREIDILALVPDLDARPAELPEARNLLPERLGDGTDQGDGLDVLERRQGVRHDIGSPAELVPASQQCAVLLRDQRAPHRSHPSSFMKLRLRPCRTLMSAR